MSDSGQVVKVLAGVGIVAGAGAVICCLLSQDAPGPERKQLASDGAAPTNEKSKVEDIKKDTVHQILQEILESQEKMKVYMKELTKELLSKSLTYEQTYQSVKKAQPIDPLEKRGISMTEFDQLLDRHQSDPKVRESIAKVMGAPNPNSSKKAASITVNEIIKVHEYMLQELEVLVASLKSRQDTDLKTMTIAAQAVVGAKMEQKFGYSSEDIESAVLMYHTMLATNQEFATINQKIQHTMALLMGNPFIDQ